MSVAVPSDNTKQIDVLLKKLRDEPINSGIETDQYLSTVFTFLMKVPATSDGTFHWFCHRAEGVTVEAATFMLRLYAYNSMRVAAWRKRLQSVVVTCCHCVRGLQRAKLVSRDTYLASFPDNVIKSFMDSLDDWEVKLVVEGLSDITAAPPTSQRPPTLLDVPPGITYHIVSNHRLIQDKEILSKLKTLVPPTPVSGWPSDPPAPGLFQLLLHEDQDVRRWAKSHITQCQVSPIAKDDFVGSYVTTFEILTRALTTHGVLPHQVGSETVTFPFSDDPVVIWAGFASSLRLLPSAVLQPGALTSVHLGRLVAGHLHDTGPQFIEILRCYMYLVKRLGAELWKGEDADYPGVIFDAIKDNPSYSQRLESLSPGEDKAWFLLWFSEYIQGLWSSPIFGDVLAKMVDFLCEELQHERIQEARPAIMSAASILIRVILKRAHKEEAISQHQAAVNALDIHVDRFAAVAFSRSHKTPQWLNARANARDLIRLVLLKDVQDVSATISELCRAFAEKPTAISIPSIHRHLWKKTYDSIQADDKDAVAMIIDVVAQSAHLSPLARDAFGGVFQKARARFSPTVAKSAYEEVNKSLAIFRDGFAEAVSKYANYNPSSSIVMLLRKDGASGQNTAKNIVALMMAPVEDIQSAAQTLVGQAFDVDIRSDCFRALLKNLPDTTLHAIFDSINTFTRYMEIVPEACDLSKALVRCLTDVIEVMCSHPDGLLHDEGFLKRKDGLGLGSELPKFWSLMTQTIAAIFKRTPQWSKFFDSDDNMRLMMIQWMRDALIFGRDMLAQWRVFEAAAVASSEAGQSHTSTSSRKFSRVGEKMVDDLQQVLPELARWLRLTDEELLHQSFALLQSMLDCFRETRIKPSGIGKLIRHVENARNPSQNTPNTRLDTTRLAKLEDALASFEEREVEEGEVEVEIISHTLPPKKAESKPMASHSTKAPRKPSPPAAKPTRSKAGSMSTSHYFTVKDQKKLEAEESLAPRPKLHRPIPISNGVPATGPMQKAPSARLSSNEQSSDEESGHEGGLANLNKFQRTPKLNKPAERRQMKVLELPIATKNAIQSRSIRRDDARRIALRMKPDISGLHRRILSWSYDSSGPDPPWDQSKLHMIHVPDQFSDFEHYHRVFEPLLLSECWAQILQSKDEPKDTYECKITSRQFIDDWVDLDITITDPLKKGWYLAETDVILFRHPGNKQSALAKALSFKATNFGQPLVQASVRCCLENGRDPGLQIGSVWNISKVFSLSTLHREYGALKGMPHYDFANFILRPALPKPVPVDNQEIQKTMNDYNVNQPQASAIASALRTNGFSLIQGPPGTGKTSTICGLVQAFLVNRPQPTTAVNVGRVSGPADKAVPKKILLCAPSNAAIDEIAHRLKEGISGFGKRSVIPKVVRVGADKALNISVRDISLDSLVDQRMDTRKDATPQDTGTEISVLRAELDRVRRLREEKESELRALHDNTAKSLAIGEEIKRLNQRRMTLSQQMNRSKDQQKSDHRTLDATRRKIRQEILSEADVICSTLSGAGHDILEQSDFEMIIIDEAAQAIELSSLIPLKYRCARCVMVGDPQQLPPTVISQEASKYTYNQSLFVRFQKLRPDAVHLLSIQYRMHPNISQLPSRVFYQGRLKDGPDMAEKTGRPWHVSAKFGTYRFFNIPTGQESNGPFRSLLNRAEVNVAVALYSRLRQEFPLVDFDSRVGVVSMYRAQIVELSRAFEQQFGADILTKVDFNTVDGFQGQEKDIIILSCVRAGPGLQSVGFLSDVRRMNVALTRARASLFVLGHCPTLERSDNTWKQIITDARARSCLIDADATYFTSAKAAFLPPAPVRKIPKQTVPQTPVIPKDLVAARSIKTSPSAKSSSTIRKVSIDLSAAVTPSAAKSTISQTSTLASAIPSSATIPVKEMQAGQKRTRPADEPNPPMDSVGPSNGPPNLKPRPPVKRQKQAAQSLFIPKKRLLPDGEAAGPSHKKRS